MRIRDPKTPVLLALVLASGGPVALAQGLSQTSSTPHASAWSAWLDFDGDGRPDLFSADPRRADALLLNRGDGRFEDVSAQVGLSDSFSRAVLGRDFDQDGDPDLLLIGRDGRLELMITTGGVLWPSAHVLGLGGLTDVARVEWTDTDLDGWLDLWIEGSAGSHQLFRNLEGRAFERLELPPTFSVSSTATVASDRAQIEPAREAERAKASTSESRAEFGRDSAGGSRIPLDVAMAGVDTLDVGSTGTSVGVVATLLGINCAKSIANQAGGGCIKASTVPGVVGQLLPQSSALFVALGGSVGVGTTSPVTDFQVAGNVVVDDSISIGTSVTIGSTMQVAGDTFLLGKAAILGDGVFVGGNLGIGTSSPPTTNNLHIQQTGSVRVVLEADTDNFNENDHPQLVFSQDGGAVKTNVGFFDGGNAFMIDSEYIAGEMYFRQFDGAGRTNDWEFQNVSDVEARLDDLGNLSLDGSVSSPAADLAEYYPLAETVEAGDVVAFSATGMELALASSNEPGRIAGIVSSRPGFLLGLDLTNEESDAVPAPPMADDERYEGIEARLAVDRLVRHEIEANQRAPLALSGRVPCKVTGESGPIRAGDFLTVSSLPGYAMRATKPGTVIGTALEDWNSGEGKILVFANLGWYAPDPSAELRALWTELGALRSELRALDGTLSASANETER